jgi:histidinol phosphatase-like enzyme (inositol monophosphatase family)
MTEEDTLNRFELAKRLAILGGKSTLDFFQRDNFEVIKKTDGSPLTLADQTCEKLLRAEIEAVFPDDGIVGEEFGVKETSNPVRWIVDPIDGTKSFISGVPLYGTMVAVEIEGQAKVGVCYFPGLDEGIFACAGHGAWWFRGEQEPIRASVSKKTNLADCVIVCSDDSTFAERDSNSVWEKLDQSVYFSRTWGDAYGYMLVATGRVDLMIDPILSIWDAAAVKPIIDEAGGSFTDWAGRSRIDSGDAIGSNGLIHQEVLKIIQG